MSKLDKEGIHLLRKFIFKNNVTGQELALPITPESYTIDHGNHVETVNLHTVGDYHLPGGRTLFTCNISGMLPRRAYPFNLPGASLDPFTYIDFFEFSSDRREVCRFVISDTPTIADVLIENWQYGEKDGTNDIYYTLTLRRFIPAKTVRQQATARSTSAQQTTQQSYTVQRGDTMSVITKRFYGNGALYPKLAAANGIKNPELIHPGQVLKLPPKASL